MEITQIPADVGDLDLALDFPGSTEDADSMLQATALAMPPGSYPAAAAAPDKPQAGDLGTTEVAVPTCPERRR